MPNPMVWSLYISANIEEDIYYPPEQSNGVIVVKVLQELCHTLGQAWIYVDAQY